VDTPHESNEPGTDEPDVTVVIPTFNRPGEIEGCLASLIQQNLERERFEVIVVDDGSLTDLGPVIKSATEKLDVHLIRQENAGAAAARNAGMTAARGRWVAFTDDDCRFPVTWLSTLVKLAAQSEDHMIGGQTVNLLEDNPYADASQVLINMIYRFYNSDPEQARFFTSNNIAVPRHKLRAVGGFMAEMRYAEDREFCHRWRAAGGGMTYRPEIVVHHRHDLTLRSFIRQHVGYGRGGYAYDRVRRNRGTGGLNQDIGFHINIFRWLPELSRDVTAGRTFQRFFLVAITQVANLYGFLIEAATRRHTP